MSVCIYLGVCMCVCAYVSFEGLCVLSSVFWVLCVLASRACWRRVHVGVACVGVVCVGVVCAGVVCAGVMCIGIRCVECHVCWYQVCWYHVCWCHMC